MFFYNVTLKTLDTGIAEPNLSESSEGELSEIYTLKSPGSITLSPVSVTSSII